MIVLPRVQSAMLRRRDLLAATLAAPLPLWSAAAPEDASGTRVALVIGNANYAQSPLINPAKDATAIADVLRRAGFAVVLLLDADRAGMEAGMAKASASLSGRRGVGLLYFAGHGLQVDWRNYMLPLGASIGNVTDVPTQTVDMQRVLDSFKAAGNRMNIVVLDACRDNPFGRGIATGNGLAPMDAPPGTFLAYATAPGTVADDGTTQSGNGPYARFLAQEMKQANARIEDVFKRVRFAVRQHSAGKQIPWESTSLEEDFSFVRGIVAPLKLSGRERDAAYDEELAGWERIKASTLPDDFYGYLARYPNGLFSELAQARIERLQRRAVRPAPGPSGVTGPDLQARRYEVGDVVWWEYEDQLKGTKTQLRRRVTAADDERAEFNGGQLVLTQTDGRVKDSIGTKNPPIIEVVADMAIGRHWRSAFTNTLDGKVWNNFYESRVVALEDFELQGQTLKVFRVEHFGGSIWPGGKVQALRRMTWVDAQRGRVLRSDATFRWPTRVGNDSGVVFKVSARVVGEDFQPR